MARGVKFTKMSGAGNDFVVIGPDEASRLGEGLVEWVRGVCRRRVSIGADGVVVVSPLPDHRIRVDFYNPDGTPAFCGNGTRCAARFAALRGLAVSPMRLETVAGPVQADLAEGSVALRLPMPEDRGRLTLTLADGALEGRRIHAGVPHFVVAVPDVDKVALEAWGPHVRRHEAFGEAGTNLDVVARGDDGLLAIRTWERGVEGETLACGSGALAAAYCAWTETGDRKIRLLPASRIPIDIEFHGASGDSGPVSMRGDARTVYEGTVTFKGR